ncbi:hypothetical protein GEMRC1_013480 [Eukaryota sp. GEM-RC1]
MAYFKSNCKIAFINTRVLRGLLRVSGNCVADDIIAYVSDRMIVDSQSIIHLISSLDLNDGHVIVDSNASIREVVDVTLNLDSLIEVKGSSELISSKINLQMINRAQFVVSHDSRFIVTNGEFLLRNDVIFQISSSVHGDVELLNLFLRDDSTFNVSCIIPIQIRYYYHFGGHRSGDSDVYINIFYHWSGGKLSSHLSTSTTIVTSAATASLDSTGTMNPRIIDNHQLNISGDGTWTRSDTTLIGGFMRVTFTSTFTLDQLEQLTLQGDFDSHLYVHGRFIKDNSYSFNHNCPTFVDGSYIIEEGNVYTQKPVIVSDGLTSIVNGHLFIEDFVFIDCTSIFNGTVEAQISLLESTSLLNVTGFYEVYGELLLDHTQSMAYFKSNCKIAFINTRVLRGLLRVSGNCVADDVIAYVSDRMIVDSQSIIHLISSLDLNDGHVIVDSNASIREVVDVTLNLDSLIEVKGSSELISSKINLQMINRAQFVVSHDSRFIVTNGEFLLRNDVIFQISSSVHGDVELLNLFLRDDSTFNVSCIIPIQIRYYYHFGGHRSGDSDVYINIFYHWSGGKLSSHLSTSTTIVTSAATASLDLTGTMNPRIIDNHQLNISGDGTWTRSDTTLIGGFMRVTSTSTFTLDQLEQLTLQGDFDSHLYVHGHLIKDNSHSFNHNCPTFVDGSYIIEEGNVYTQKPVIVSNGLTSIVNGHLFIEDFVFIDCTSIFNGTVEAQISLLESTSLLNVTGFYEVYGELLLDHTQSMVYFNSNCKIEFINTRVLRGLLHVSGNCIADDVIGYVSDRMIVDAQSLINLISSLDLNDGHVIVDGIASIREVVDVTLNLDSLIEVKGSVEIISSKINLQMINRAQFIVSHDSRFIITNGEFLLRNDVIFQISSSVHGNVELLNLFLRDDSTFNVSCIIPIQIRYYYHFGGHRSGDSDVYINIFYHWSGGKLSSHLSSSTTIVTSAATASLDSTGTMNPRIIDNHLLLLIGDVTWTHSDTTLLSGFINITTYCTLTILNQEHVELDGDFDSHLYVHGHLLKDNSYSFNHNCPTFVDGSYIIEEGNVYTQKPVIVSDGLTSIVNGHLFIEDFVFIDCTSIFNGTVEAQISLLESTSLLNVTGFYEVYGELLLDHTQSMTYFNSNCKISFINTRVLRGLLHVSGNCIADDVIGYVSDRMIVDTQSIIHLISSLDLNDGHVIVDGSASVREVVDVTLNLDSLIEVKGSVELISSKINLQMINRAQFIVSHDSRFIITNGEFLLRNDVIFQISSSVHGNVELLNLFLRDDSTFNVSCIIPIQIRYYYHFGGHRSGDSDVYINIFYHWSGGKLSSHLSTSTTIVTSAATASLDSTGTMNPRIIDNHLLLLIGDVTWTHSDTTLLSGFINITTYCTLTILNQEHVELDGDFDSHLYVHGHLLKDNSYSFNHNCPTFVDGSYIIEEGNVYTQKPVIVSDGLTSIVNGHLFIEDFVFIDCTSIFNGTVEAQISLLESTSLLNVTGFYEVYGELLLDHTQSMTYFNSNCKISFINTRVLRGLLHVSGNCIADDVIGYVSDRMIVDTQSIIHLISSLDLNDGHVIVDGSASVREVVDVTLNLDSLIEVKGSVELISSKINLQMINRAQFIVSHDSRFIITNGEFLLRNDVIFQISSSVHGNVELLNLFLRDDSTFNVSCIIPIQIRYYYHFGGHRSGDSDVYINIFYHWSGGKLSSHLSTSTTIVTSAATGLLDSTGTMNPRIIDNHLLLLIGDVTWTHSDTTLLSGFINITTDSTLTIVNQEHVELDGDFDSHLYVHGHLIKDNSYSFNHNCPTFVDGSYIIEEGNVYTQKPVIVSDGLTSIVNGHLFIEDFVFIDCTSILNGTVEAQISLLESTSLLNVTGFYEVYGELLLDHTQSMAYFNSNCKISFINTRVLRGLLHVSGNCIADDVIGYVSDRMLVDTQSIIHLISSLDLNDGHVIVDGSASIREVVDVTLNLDSLIEVKGSVELISSKINLQMINRAQFIVSHDSRFIITNGEFLLRNDVIFQISSSVHGNVELLNLFLRDDSTFNVSCVIPIQIRYYYHFGGHRSGDSDFYINIFYHWSGGKLSSHLSTSTTIVTSAATALLDSTGTMNPRIIDNHLLLFIGDVTWTHSDTSLLSGFINITTDSTLTILNQEDVELDGDFDSHLYVHGHLIKDNSHSFTHNCPTFVDGSYIIEEGNVYTQKPVIVSNGVHAINNGHLFIEEFFLLIVQISLLKPTSLLNVTGFYEVYGELLLDHTQSMAYFKSNCKIAFINTRVLRGLLRVSGNCVADDVIAYVSDRMIVDSQSIIHLISSLDLNDGHVIVDSNASIREVVDVTLNLDSLIEVKGSSELISSKINLQMINRAQFVVSHDSRFIVTNGEFLLRNDVIFQISSSVHGDVELLNLFLRDDSTFNVSCIIPIQIRYYYHFGGHRSGDSDVYINIFYHWSGGKLSSHLSTSTTIVTSAATASLDSTGTMNPRIIDNHQLNISGDGTWTRSDTTLIGGFMRVTFTSTFTLDQLEQLTLQGDFDSHLYVHGRFIKDNSYSFNHNCPTFVDGSYIIEEGNVYTQKPVIVSDGLTSIVNGHLFIEDFVFIDCTSIFNGTAEAQISLLESTSLLNVTGFYEVYGELLLDHTQSMAYFKSNCKIAFINTRVLRGLLRVSGNCVADDVIAYVSDRMIVDSQSIIHLISSLDLNDGHVIVDSNASIREVVDVTLNLDSLIEVKGSSELISSKINLQMINRAQFVVSHDSRFIVTNGEFLLRNDVIFQISSSVHGNVELLNLFLRDDSTFNVSCIIPIQIRYYYHFGGHRSGDSDVNINIFYHWSGGKLSSHLSTSTTIVTSAATASLDLTGTMNPRIIDNHLLLLIGDVTWTHSGTSLLSGFINITTYCTLTILNQEHVELDGDFDSHLFVHGGLIKDNSYSFNHNCPTFVDGSYIIEEGNVYTQKPVIVSDGLTSIINGHLFVEDFVFIDCTSILNGTEEAQISLMEPTSLLNVTGFYEVYGELLLDHTQSMAYFNSNCKIAFINTRVLRGLLHVSGNCIADDVISYVSDKMIVDSQSIIF